MDDSKKKKLTADQKARLVSDVSIALKQMEDEERKKQSLKQFSEKLVKENYELKAINDVLLIRLSNVDDDLADTKKEVSDIKEELVKTNNLLIETIQEQNKQKEIIILLSSKFKDLKMEEPSKTK